MKRILVANDLSSNSANALARAIKLAAEDGAEIRVIHAASGPEGDFPAAQRRICTEAQTMAEEMTGLTLGISAQVALFPAAEAILEEAERFDADLIVLGAHGLPRFRDALFGTTGTHVVRHSDRPVLIVQNDAVEPYARVLAAVDGIETAPAIFAVVRDIARASELFAVHAFQPTLKGSLGGATGLDRDEARVMLSLEKLLGAYKSEGVAPLVTATQHAIVESGEAMRVIMDETEALLPDLVAMGTRRKATYLGSRAVDTLFWCPSDILIVPDRAGVNADLASASA
jgi:nucleotide-binding universal stress UspA family protein